MPRQQTIIVQQHCAAPAKPVVGACCNGCGLCCLVEPCPVARLWLWQQQGACRALSWQPELQRYVCGLVLMPDHYLWYLPRCGRGMISRFFASRVASGSGCDFEADAN